MSGFNFILAEKLVDIYQEERLKEAELARLAREIRVQQPKKTNRLGVAFVRLGRQLVCWGMRLQSSPVPHIQLVSETKEASG